MTDIKTLPSLENLPEKHQQSLLGIITAQQQVRGNQAAVFWTTLTFMSCTVAPFLLNPSTPAKQVSWREIQHSINSIYQHNPACYAKIAGNRKPDVAALKGNLFQEEVLRGISVCFTTPQASQRYLQAVDRYQNDTAFSWTDWLRVTFIWTGFAAGTLISFCVWFYSLYTLRQGQQHLKTHFTQLVLAGVEPAEIHFLLQELHTIGRHRRL